MRPAADHVRARPVRDADGGETVRSHRTVPAGETAGETAARQQQAAGDREAAAYVRLRLRGRGAEPGAEQRGDRPARPAVPEGTRYRRLHTLPERLQGLG